MTMNFNFDTSYTTLPSLFFHKTTPSHAPDAKIIAANNELASAIGIDLDASNQQQLADLFSGNKLPRNTTPFSQAYAGHQYGHFTMLGDGRALVWGEHITPKGKRVDIQFKGSGPTPYSRQGDGKAALGPMLREYLVSEAMHHLGVPTTRSLAVASTGETIQRQSRQTGAVLTRVASSHIRIGTFEFASIQIDKSALPKLLNYTIQRHYPELAQSDNKALALLGKVIDKQCHLIIEWMRVGFIHGVMNTDNMTISGETIDYGPCAFMDNYNPNTVYSAIDQMGRYAFQNQPKVALWNLARFAESLLPLIHSKESEAITLASNKIEYAAATMDRLWIEMMRRKLGLTSAHNNDHKLISQLLDWMHHNDADYTNTFMLLSRDEKPCKGIYDEKGFNDWYQNWQKRLKCDSSRAVESRTLMQKNNPVLIPRNHTVEKVLNIAETGDIKPFQHLHQTLRKPYTQMDSIKPFQKPPRANERIRHTFCGT